MIYAKATTRKSLLGFVLTALLLVPAGFAQTAAEPSSADQPFSSCPAEGEPDDQKKAMQYSLYYENFKNQNYESALPYLRWMLQCAPTFTGPGRTGDRNFERAIQAYEALAEQAEGEEQTRAYLDSALMVFDMAVPTMKEQNVEFDEYEWAFKRGYFLQSHAQQLPDQADQAAKYYQDAYEMNPDSMGPYYLNFIISDYMQRGDMASALDMIRAVNETRSDEPKVAEVVSKYMEQIPPQERMAFLESQLEKDPENAEIMEQLFELYSNLGERQKMYQLGQKLQQMDSSPEVTRLLANMYIEDGEYNKAFTMMEELVQQPDYEAQAQDYYNMGLAQQNMDRLSSARTYYRKAVEADRSFGQAYLAIGDLYASAVRSCSGGRNLEREDRAVYWLAADYYQRAKSANSDLTSVANQKTNNYQPYFPSSEDLFFWGKTAGDRYMVDYGCYSWISEATQVRKP